MMEHRNDDALTLTEWHGTSRGKMGTVRVNKASRKHDSEQLRGEFNVRAQVEYESETLKMNTKRSVWKLVHCVIGAKLEWIFLSNNRESVKSLN